MYVVIVSSDGNGCGRAYGPYETNLEASLAVDEAFAALCALDETTPNIAIAEGRYAYSGPWLDVLEIHPGDSIIDDQKWSE